MSQASPLDSFGADSGARNLVICCDGTSNQFGENNTNLVRLVQMLRRDTPASYALNIKEAEEYIKDTRAEALDSFYGHSVLREPPADKTPAPETPKEGPEAIKRP